MAEMIPARELKHGDRIVNVGTVNGLYTLSTGVITVSIVGTQTTVDGDEIDSLTTEWYRPDRFLMVRNIPLTSVKEN